MSQFRLEPAPDFLVRRNLANQRLHRQFPTFKAEAVNVTFPLVVKDENDAPSPGSASAAALVGTSEGIFESMLFSIPYYVTQSGGLSEIYVALANDLPDFTKFVIVTHRRAYDVVANWFSERQAQIIPVDDDIYFSLWAEDPYAVVFDERAGTRSFIDPYIFERNADNVLSSIIAGETGFRRRTAPLIFQGGNLLIGDDFFLIGGTYLIDTISWDNDRHLFTPPNGSPVAKFLSSEYRHRLDATRKAVFVGCTRPLPAEIHRRIDDPSGGNDQWTEVVYFGNDPGTVQPLFHIDMFISLAGRGQDGGKYRIFVGSPKCAAELTGDALPEFAEQWAFDEIADQLTDCGFEVRRNPLPLIYADITEYKARIWYFASSNNLLVQNAPRNKRVWLPTYAHGPWAEKLTATDAANKKMWEDLGYTVTLLPDFHLLASNLGAAHCIKKYLARGPCEHE